MTETSNEEQLVVSIVAKLGDLEAQMAKANGITARAFREMSLSTRRATTQMELDAARSAERINAALATIGTKIGDVGKGFAASIGGALGASLSVETVVKYADEWKRAGNQLAGAGVELSKVAATQQVVSDIAIRSRSDIGSTTELYARLTRSAKDLGANQAQIAVATETVSKGLKLSGASASEAAGAMLQLSQALQSGSLAGDELRSLRENAPVIMQAIAKEFEVPIGQLKQLGSEGKLTADRVFKAIVDSADDVDKAFAKTTPTVEEAFKSLEASAVRFAGTSSTVQFAASTITTGLQKAAANVDGLATGATALGAIIASRLIAGGLTPFVAAIGQAVAGGAAAVGTMSALGVAAAGLSRVMAIAGGPVGLAILGIGVAATYAAQKSAEAEARSRAYAEALAAVRDKASASAAEVGKYGEAVVRAAEQQAKAQTNELNSRLKSTEADIAALTGRILGLLESYGRLGSSNKEQSGALRELARDFVGTRDGAEKAMAKLDELASSNPNFGSIAAKLTPLLEQLAGAAALADQLRGSLSAIPKAVAEAKDKSIERKITAGVPQISYEDASATPMRDPTLMALKADGILQREVAHAEMEKTARAIADEKAKLIDQIREAGGTVDMTAVDLAAKRIVAAKERDKTHVRSDQEDEYERMGRRIAEHIDALNAEAAAIGKTEREQDKAKATQQLLTAAQQADVEVTAEVRASIDTLADRYANAADHARKLEKAQHDAVTAADEFRSTTKDVLTGFISDLRQGKSGAEALASALSKIYDKVIDKLVGSLVDGALGKQGTAATGLFGSILKLFGFSNGGAFGAAGVRAFATGGAFTNRIVDSPTLFRFAGGTGLMGEAGPEAIMPLSRDRNGRLGVQAPAAGASDSASGGTATIVWSPTINAQGADVAAVARLTAELAAERKTFETRVVGVVNEAIHRSGKIRVG